MASILIIFVFVLLYFLRQYVAINQLREDVSIFSTDKLREEMILNLSFNAQPDYCFSAEELKEAEKIAYHFWIDLKGWFFQHNRYHLKANVNVWEKFYHFAANYSRSSTSLKLLIALKRHLIVRCRKYKKGNCLYEEALYADYIIKLSSEV